MKKKVVDFESYRIEKFFRDSGFDVKRDEKSRLKILIKLSNGENEHQ